MRRQTSTFRRIFTVGCVLMWIAIMSGPLASKTEASVFGCRSDPIVILSDGSILDVSADIRTSVGNVDEIHYTVHGPRGAHLVAAIRTPTIGFSGKETFTYLADSQPREYVIDTLVHIRGSVFMTQVTARVTFANISLLHAPLLSLQYRPVVGSDATILRVMLKR